MRRHNSAPSISGMDQSEMTTADWRVRNTLQASAPLVVAVTSYPSPLSAAFRYRPATGSSSTRRTCMGGSAVTQVVEDRRHLAFQRREFPLDVLEHALPGGALDFREQQCEPARADGARRRLERVRGAPDRQSMRSEEHTSELQSLAYLVCRLLLEKKKDTPRG